VAALNDMSNENNALAARFHTLKPMS